MKKISLFALVALLSLVMSPLASAKNDEVSADVDMIYLGKKYDKQTGLEVEGIKFIHYKKGFAKGGSAARKPRGTTCYSFMADGAKWKSVENWVMNPSNNAGLDQTEVFNLMSGGIAKWEDAADGIVGNGSGVNFMGSGLQTNAELTADQYSTDGVNEVYFDSIPQSGVIAQTIVWGIFGGLVQNRVLVEWDMVFDDTDFSWNTNGSLTDMDFDNIATHEIGHAAGMSHPSNSCSLETMYAYATEGEILKRTLNSGDIAGINKLY